MNLLESDLFQRALGESAKGKEDAARIRLRESLLRFRERAGMLAEEIHRSMPSLTVHGGTHLDALWEMADLIAGPAYPLNPVEAFTLGGAFLLHDLGLALAAWPMAIDGLKEDAGWKDAVAGHLRRRLGRVPAPEEIAQPPAEVEQAALQEWLRLRHAGQAEQLAMTSWRDPRSGVTYHLLEDVELRQALGPVIGRIAHSHWWPVVRLTAEFGLPLGAPAIPDFPGMWTLDPLKLAVLLRVADASHLDARRAPGFLQALRHPDGKSWEHWVFQNHLLKPRVEEDRLVFTTARAFPREEAEAWWLCLDTLRMVDAELRQSDALLADTRRPRLRARSVAGVEDAHRLQRYVLISDWTPVDARIHVSNVADIVEQFGGEQLYGKDPTVPLRELIQNAADAVRARRALEGWPSDWGRITVRLSRDTEGPWIEVQDTGIGMSEAVLSGPLLDFGSTYWGSALMLEEHPGLWTRGFEPTGRFGIGFFSVFMWGTQVRVITRRYDEALRETRVLEFRTGLRARPLVRPARPEEQLRDPGTQVRVWLKREPDGDGGLFEERSKNLSSIQSLCAWIAPALDVDLYTEEKSESGIAVRALDWLTLDGLDLFARLEGMQSSDLRSDYSVRRMASNLRLIGEESGRIVGRASIGRGFPPGIMAVGGLRAKPPWKLSNFSGILVGYAEKTTRDEAVPAVGPNALSCWATEQARLGAETFAEPHDQIRLAKDVLSFGGKTESLTIARRQREFVNFEQIANWVSIPNKVILVSSIQRSAGDSDETEISFHPNVLFLEEDDLWVRVVEALARAWKCSMYEVIQTWDLPFNHIEVGERAGTPIYSWPKVFRNPRSRARRKRRRPRA